MSRLFFVILFIAIPFFLISCFKELTDDINNIDNLTWNPKLALPLANGSFTIGEFAEELSGDNFGTSTRDDGLVVFHYAQDKVFSETAEEIVNIRDKNYNASIRPSGASLPDLPISGTITEQELHEFSVGSSENDKLYSAKLKGGSIQIDLNGNFPASGELLLIFHGLTRNDAALETSFQWNYDGANTQQFQRTIDLSGSDIDFTDGGRTFNYFHFTTSLTLNYEGQSITISENIDLNMDILSMEFSEFTANINRRVITRETNEFTFNFLDELTGGVYYFDEPAINFHFSNGFGIPIEATIIETIAHSNERSDLGLTGSIVGDPIAIGYPSTNEKGTAVETSIGINHQNSNLPAIITWQPNTISYTFEGVVNPDSNDDIHFALDTSRISADIDLELPMIGRFRNLTLKEHYDFNGGDLEEAKYALFRLQTTNGFPIDAHIQLYFGSGTGTFIDSLIHDDTQILKAGLTNSVGKVTEPTLKDIDVLVPKDRLGPISEAQRLMLRARLDTPENDTRSVSIYEEDRLNVKLYVQTEFEIIL
ncbi:MAG: hypothetical protein MI975_23725 [Cytophagales bacterium]|nr:hypothetical protein [Cytophagales bacterium]